MRPTVLNTLPVVFQNGVVERCNRTLIEVARTMLIYAQAPLFLWAEAMEPHVIHKINPLFVFDMEKLRMSFCTADVGIFIGYAPTKKAFRIYNRRTIRIVETIHVDFDELTAMASEQSSSGPALHDMTPGTINNFATNTLNTEDTPSSSSIVIEEDEAPQIVSSSAEAVATEPNTPVLNENVDELVQEDVAELDENVFYNPLYTHVFEEAESSSTYQDPSNIHEFHQTHRSTDKWTKNDIIEQVIGDPSKPIESLQDELNLFKGLDVWELVECSVERYSMSTSNQQTLADSGANERSPSLKKENYIPWESRFIRFLDNKLEEGERMWRSIEKGPYVRPMIPDPDNTRHQRIKPLSKMTEINKKQYITDVRVMNYLL
nr:hypothetical protein [Tanacetum cinerariifolium]